MLCPCAKAMNDPTNIQWETLLRAHLPHFFFGCFILISLMTHLIIISSLSTNVKMPATIVFVLCCYVFVTYGYSVV